MHFKRIEAATLVVLSPIFEEQNAIQIYIAI